MRDLVYTSQFRRDLKRIRKRGANLKLLTKVLDWIRNGEPLPKKLLDHPLTGDYIGFRECHIQPDWLLIYAIRDTELVVVATRTGMRSDLLRI